jgi:hypothetical protein
VTAWGGRLIRYGELWHAVGLKKRVQAHERTGMRLTGGMCFISLLALSRHAHGYILSKIK